MKNETTKPLAPVISLQNAKTKEAESTEDDPLTIAILRTCKGYENFTDEQAVEAINSLNAFIEIVVLTYLKNNIVIDNQQVIYLNSENKQIA